MPKVSIIVPVYNVVDYLPECLDSIINQTLQDVEIICVDDGSSDDSLSILKRYEKADSRIRIFEQENKGAGVARNMAIDLASGEYIAFMDSDDWYPEADVLETLYSKAIQNNSSICGGSLGIVENGELINVEEKYLFCQEGTISFDEYQFEYGYTRFIYNREMLVNNNIYFPTYRHFEDPVFFVKAMLCAGNFYTIPKLTYLYRSGHKATHWDRIKVNDVARAMIDILELSKIHTLPILHRSIIGRLNNTWFPFFEYITLDNIELLSLLLKANALIDIEMLKKTECCTLEPLKELFSGVAPVRKNFLQKIFSIINTKHYKVLTIFGTEIMFKRNSK